MWWKQISRVDWLTYGDKNTQFFHKKASQRNWKNTIRGLKDSNGEWKTSFDELQSIMVDFYSELFTAGDLVGVDNCCGALKRNALASLHQDLLRPFSREDVLYALHDMSPTKTSGSYGFSAMFYQKYWDVVGPDLSTVV